MKRLRWKAAAIIVVILAFLYGIFGIPRHLSAQGLSSALMRRIHLELDLEGGTHMIMQVQVNDAVKVDAQQALRWP